jgi:transcriptional regulator with GAF, ATPase, and Fis domain
VAVSVLDQFRDAEQRVAQRLKELEPAVTEYRELEAIAQRLGIEATATPNGTSDSAPAPGRRRSSRVSTKSTRRDPKRTSAVKKARPRAPRSVAGEREQQMLELVKKRPGITVAEAGKALGVDPTGLYRVVRRLEERGEVRKDGRSLQAVGARSAA